MLARYPRRVAGTRAGSAVTALSTRLLQVQMVVVEEKICSFIPRGR